MPGDLIGLVGQAPQFIGELLVNLKKIDRNQLTSALSEQAKLNSRLGDILVNKGFLTQQELDNALAIQNNRNPQAPMLARKMLGDLLLESGKLTTVQLHSALETQNLTQQKIGEVLIQMGFVSQHDIDSALNLQDNLAFSSRARILDSLEARSAGERVHAKQTGPLPRELAEAYTSKGSFLEAAATRAFQSAFGRSPTLAEQQEFNAKLAFIFPEGAKLQDPLGTDFNRAVALQKLSGYFQNVIAERIIQMVGGDAARKKFDRLGNVEVTGLSVRDLELAIEVATAPEFQAKSAIEKFLERSPRAFFRAAMGRDFASAEEAASFEKLLDGSQAEANRNILRRLQGLLQDTFSAFPLARSDKAIRESLALDEQELKELLKSIRDFGEREALRLFREKEGWFRKLELARTTESALRSQLEQIKTEQQIRKVLDLLQQILGHIPASLMRMIKQLIAMVGTEQIPNLDSLIQLILNLIERIMQQFQSVMGRAPSPDEMAQAMEMAFGAIAEGKDDPLQIIEQFVSALKDGKSPQGGMPQDKALAFVNQMNLEFKGEFKTSVTRDDPWVLALVSGEQTSDSMKEAFKSYYKDGQQGIGLPEALAFVEFMNLSYRGVAVEADPFDPYVQKLLTGDMTPGEVDREWKANAQTPASL